MILDPKHIHEYKRVPKSKSMYMCNHPHCTHRLSRIYLDGKASLCTKCKTEFVLDKYDLKLANPLCHLHCSTRPEFVKQRELAQQLENVLVGFNFDERGSD